MPAITVERVSRTLTITLNRPDSLNALDLELAGGLLEAVSDVEDADSIVLTGAGRAFCAGGDVRAMAASGDAPEYVKKLTDMLHPLILRLLEVPIPVIARVNGPVAGAGIGLVLASDVVVAAESARFSAAYGRLSVTPDCGVSALLPLAVGRARSSDFLLRARTIDALTAHAWGLVGSVAADAELDRDVAAVIEQVTTASARANDSLKQLLGVDMVRLRAHLDREAASIALLVADDPARSRLMRFADG